MNLHEWANVSLRSLQYTWPNKMDAKAAVSWSSLAKFLTPDYKEGCMMPTPIERPVRYLLEDPKSKWLEYTFLRKTLNKLGIEMNILKLIKTIYDKSTARILFKGERLNLFS